MSVDNETVRKVAFLARLKVEPEKLEETKIEFNNILEWVEKLGEVNTDNVEPLVSVNDEALTLRQDNITAGQMSEQILKMHRRRNSAILSCPRLWSKQDEYTDRFDY